MFPEIVQQTKKVPGHSYQKLTFSEYVREPRVLEDEAAVLHRGVL